jgi:hypothetical protein
VFENRVLRRIFGSKMEEVMGRWGKYHNEEGASLLIISTHHQIMRSCMVCTHRPVLLG